MLSQQSHRISKEPSFLDLSTLSLSVFGKDLTRGQAADFVYIATDQICVRFFIIWQEKNLCPALGLNPAPDLLHVKPLLLVI